MVVPAADQALAPFLGDHFVDPAPGCPGQRTERVAVHINDAARQLEVLTTVAQRIFLVPAADRRVGNRISPFEGRDLVEFSVHLADPCAA